MALIFDNPAGGLALLGVPAVIAIHMLRARLRRTRVSTLFLLAHLAPENRGGLVRDRLRASLPLLLRLAAVLLLAWTLAEPRWVRPDARRRVAVVLDSSISMSACRDRVLAALPDRLASLSRGGVTVEYTVIESDPARPRLHRGKGPAALREALARWRPTSGEHDMSAALAEADLIARDGGVAVLVTDTPEHRVAGAATLAYGEFVENTGFAGVAVAADGNSWTALVRHHGRAPRRTTWRVETGGAAGTPVPLDLNPGEVATLSGEFPAGTDRFLLRLDADAFPADDTLPVVRPSPKPIRVFISLTGDAGKLAERALDAMPAVRRAATVAEADLVFATIGDPTAEKLPAVLFPSPGSATVPMRGPVLAEPHPLVSGTSWQGLSPALRVGAIRDSRDTPLVWGADTPLVFLRARDAAPDALIFDFPPETTNARRLPAFVTLLRRRVETVRETLPAAYATNTDTRARISVGEPATGLNLRVGDGPPRPLTRAEARTLRAPDLPDFFTVSAGDVPRVTGAAAFADVREADFSRCAPADTLASRERQLTRAVSSPDPWRPLWLALIAGLLLAAWWTQRERTATTP